MEYVVPKIVLEARIVVPKSLEISSFQYVAKHICYYCKSTRRRNYLLSCLPPYLLLELFRLLKCWDYPGVMIESSKLGHGLQQLGINKPSTGDLTSHMMTSLGTRCMHLSTLDLPGLDMVSVSSAHLARLIANLPRLTSLNLSHTFCPDDILESVGGHCVEMLQLRLRKCRMITDRGLLQLSGGDGRPGCQRLQLLDIISVPVSKDAVSSLIKHLNELVWLYWADLCGILVKMHHTDRPTLNRLKIGHLHWSPEMSLKVYRDCLPLSHLTSFVISRPMSKLHYLLSPVGHTLKELTLLQCTVAVNKICTYCLNLEKLTFKYAHLINECSPSYGRQDVDEPEPWSYSSLRHLVIRDCSAQTDLVLIAILRTAVQIETIKLSQYRPLTPHLIESEFHLIQASNPLSRLRLLRFHFMHVPMSLLRMLLALQGSMQYVQLFECRNLKMNRLSQMTSQRGWRLKCY